MSKAPKWFIRSNYERELSIEDWIIEFERRCDLKDIYGLNLYSDIQKRSLGESLANEIMIESILRSERHFSPERISESLHKYMSSVFDAAPESTNIDVNFGMDIFLPEDLLIKKFKSQLKRNRDALARACNNSFYPNRLDQRMKSWTNNSVLAVFDLFYWSRLSRQALSDDDIALIIWPNNPSVEKLLREAIPRALEDVNRLWLQVLTQNYLEKKSSE